MGRGHMDQARAIRVKLDSLGLGAPQWRRTKLPEFVLMVVHNPYRPTASSVRDSLYWFRGGDLRQQGVVMKGDREPRMRVWWTAKTETPYQWAVPVGEPPSPMKLSCC